MDVIPGRRAVAEALRARRALTELVIDGRRADALEPLVLAARDAGVTVRSATMEQLDDLAHGVTHQGVVARAAGGGAPALSDVASGDLLVVLDGVTDPQNFGAIARSAEVAGAAGLVVPRRRSASRSPAAEKAAAGALSWLPVVTVPNVVRALEQLADAGFWSVGLDGDASASLWDSNLLDGRVVVVIGAEGRGLSRLVRERVDQRVAIPMHGHIGSLNAGMAATVALFEVVRRRSS